jgi:hypothetical protein
MFPPSGFTPIAAGATISGMSTGHHPLTHRQEEQLREELAAVEEFLQASAVLMRACYGQDSQVPSVPMKLSMPRNGSSGNWSEFN